jgi:hypothetical protein
LRALPGGLALRHLAVIIAARMVAMSDSVPEFTGLQSAAAAGRPSSWRKPLTALNRRPATVVSGVLIPQAAGFAINYQAP